jgi:S1-C subfamily serine protease
MSERIFIRLGKQTRGPFDQAQLQRMMNLGQFGRMHEVSENRTQWRSARAMIDQWSPAPGTAKGRAAKEEPAAESSISSSPPTTSNPVWFYHVAGAQVGPKTADEVRSAITAQAIKRNALLWREGLADWTPADRFPEFFISSGRATNRGPLLLAFVFLILSAGAFGFAAWQKGWFNEFFKPAATAREPVATAREPVATTRTVEGKAVAFLSLPENATPAQVTSAYRDRVYHLFIKVEPWTLKLGGKQFPIGGGEGTGSGIALAHDGRTSLIATNRHVICPDSMNIVGDVLKAVNLDRDYYKNQVFEGGRRLSIKQPDWLEPRNALVAAIHRERDVAVVLHQSEGIAPFAIRVVSRLNIEQGERAVALGNPLGLEFFTTDGLITSTHGQQRLEGMICTNCSVSSGNSGGPLLLSRHGYLVGLNTLASTGGRAGVAIQNLNAAEPIDEPIRSLADRRNDEWYWNPKFKELTTRLAKLVEVVEK